MLVTQLIDEDFVNFRKPSMFIGTSKCTMKCEIEYGKPLCQNHNLIGARGIPMEPEELVKRYMKNRITKAVVFGGLEPFDSALDLYLCVKAFREKTNDPIIIYSGYTLEELKYSNLLQPLMQFENIIIKFGRYIPNLDPYYNQVLGIQLAGSNQNAKHLSRIKKEMIEEGIIRDEF